MRTLYEVQGYSPRFLEGLDTFAVTEDPTEAARLADRARAAGWREVRVSEEEEVILV